MFDFEIFGIDFFMFCLLFDVFVGWVMSMVSECVVIFLFWEDMLVLKLFVIVCISFRFFWLILFSLIFFVVVRVVDFLKCSILL